MTRVYYRDSHGAVVLFDTTRKETLSGAFRWKKDLDSKLVLDDGEPIPAILVANKCDLDGSISSAELEKTAKQAGFKASFQVSAKTGMGVEDAMSYLLRNVVLAERDGLYMTPIFQRDRQIHRLAAEDEPPKTGLAKSIKNVCC
ncbi:Ras family protein [Aphelenchoides avenae]|nr:Ras family protein [Aphelenchus avenae]